MRNKVRTLSLASSVAAVSAISWRHPLYKYASQQHTRSLFLVPRYPAFVAYHLVPLKGQRNLRNLSSLSSHPTIVSYSTLRPFSASSLIQSSNDNIRSNNYRCYATKPTGSNNESQDANSSDDDDEDDNDYDFNEQNQSQNESNDDWFVPNYIRIPEEQIEFTFVRSSGAGGQNVNKVNTQVQIRFHVLSASWLPFEVRQRMIQQQSNRMNNAGYITVSSQEHRTQTANRKDAVSKLQNIILQAWPRPKKRKPKPIALSAVTKERRKQEKQHRKEKKNLRRKVIDID